MVRKVKFCRLCLLVDNIYICHLMKMQEQLLLMHGVDIMEHCWRVLNGLLVKREAR